MSCAYCCIDLWVSKQSFDRWRFWGQQKGDAIKQQRHWKRSCWCFDRFPRVYREWLHFIIFSKGKIKCRKSVEKTKKSQNPFSILGENWEVSNDLFFMLEEYVCQLYGYWNKSTDRVRFQIYDKKYIKENKVINMAALPPCSLFYDYISSDLTW